MMAKRPLSLHVLVMGLVLGGSVLPLGLVGFWLAQSAVRSGRTLLSDELDLMLDRFADGVQQRWASHRGNILLLAHNAEVGRALAHEASFVRDDSVRSYLSELHQQMRVQLPLVVIRDTRGGVRWQLKDSVPAVRGADKDPGVTFDTDPPYIVTEVIIENGRRVGELEAHVRLAGLIPVDSATRQVAGARVSVTDSNGMLLYTTNADGALQPELVLTRQRNLRQPAFVLAVSAPMAAYVEPFRRASRAGMTVLFSMAAISLLLTTVLARRLTRPLYDLAGAAESVSRGSLDQQVALNGPDEVRRVATAFNRMTGNLRSILDKMAGQRSLVAVGEFAASLAHEVRNALTAVRVDLQRARKKTRDDDVIELLERTLGHVQHLDRVVTGALQVARTGHMQSTVLDLANVLAAAERTVASDLARAQVILTHATPNGAHPIAGDGAALQQLFTNLMLNAAEASPPGAHIEISTRDGRVDVIVEIKDTGTGIPATKLEQIWEPLFTTKPNGTGLGLPIARQIAVAHGGEVMIESSGNGTIARVRLPIAR